ncbi:MAG TPA: hypothetical protein PLF61_01420 [Candidatus Goldiibacteriota bacterium]|nr:hypothetical protein [Candidatus Goldiibacteriota bacterium]
MENNDQGNLKPTIVGVRPPETKINFGERPIGIELLLKKAKVDVEFRKILIRDRSKVAQIIFLELDPDEALILDSIPEEQLLKMIDNIDVPEEQVSAFKKYVAAAMITAMGLTPVFVGGCVGKRNPACSLPEFSATLTATATNSFIPFSSNTPTRTQTQN